MDICKTILHFLKTGNYSGAENVAITIIVEMRKKYNYKGIYVSLSGDIDEILEKNHIEHAILTANSKKEYERVIKAYHPDVIHAHDFGTSVLVSSIKNNALKISHLHNNPPWISGVNIRSLAYLWASRKFEYILSVSESVFSEYVFEKQIREKAMVVSNPVDIHRVKELARIADEYEENDIIFLGRLSSPKNPIRFLNIIDACKTTRKNIKTAMIGKGELKSVVEESIIKMGLENNIKLLGFKSNPYGYLKHAKVLCVPSDWEGFGLVIVEAFALGIPVVATPVGGMKTLVTEDTGKLCSSIGEFKEEILKLLTDEKYYGMKSQMAYERAEELDNLREYIDKMHLCYKRM